MIEYVRDEALPDREEILARLASHDRDIVLRILTQLCPCRNVCYDADIWRRLVRMMTSRWDFDVREAASHALGTLSSRARVDSRSRALLAAVAAGVPLSRLAYPQWLRPQVARGATWQTAVYPKVALRDVPTLIEALASDDELAMRDAMAALCPSGGRHPPRRVWRAIAEHRGSLDADVRAKAARAVARLGEHARACGRHAT